MTLARHARGRGGQFTEKGIQALKGTGSRQILTETGVPADQRGLQLVVGPTGAKAFYLRFKVDGQSRQRKLGDHPALPLSKARDLVREYRKVLALTGRDPFELEDERREAERKVAEAEARREAQAAANTVSALIDDFHRVNLVEGRYRRGGKGRKPRKNPDWALAALAKHVRPVWGDTPAHEITRRDAVALIDGIVERGSPVMANRVAALLSQMFDFALDRGWELSGNPCARLGGAGAIEQPRDRSLSDDEIRTLWHRLDTAPLQPRTRTAIRLLLVTGQRRGELVAARWDEIDTEAMVWHIPAANAKNGHAHDVPLSDLALQLFQSIKRRGPFVFQAKSPHDGAMDGRVLTRAVRLCQAHIGIDQWTAHDLRRTVATKLAELGVQARHVSAVLNHRVEGITAEVYDRHDYLEEKRLALQAWADRLHTLVQGGNVVPIKRGKRAK